jgi:hypothetical protein
MADRPKDSTPRPEHIEEGGWVKETTEPTAEKRPAGLPSKPTPKPAAPAADEKED